MSTSLDHQRMEWRERLVLSPIHCLIRDAADKETVLEIVSLAIKHAYDEGVQDSTYIVGRLAKKTTGEPQRALMVAERALRHLSAINARDGI